MHRATHFRRPRRARGLVVFVCVLAAFTSIPAAAAERDSKAVAIVESAVEALGGQRYLAVKAIQSSGVFTAFFQGQRGLPVEFVDTFVYPLAERTEFGKKKSRVIQTNEGGAGWKYDAARELLEAQTDDETRRFRESARATLENLLRAAVRDQEISIRSLGRGEIAPRRRADGVSIEYADGFRVEVFFELDSKLPALVRYREGAPVSPGQTVEIRYFTFVDHGGVKLPRIVDFYKDGVQTGRAVTERVVLDPAVPAAFFAKPASAKDVK